MDIEYERLLCRVSERLAGRPLELRFAEPPYAGALGCVVNDGGKCVVYVHPNIDADTKFSVYLHELAHVKIHWRFIPATTHASAPGSSIPLRSTVRLGEVIGRPVESEADTLAARWLRLANGNLWRAVGAPDKNTARLMALDALKGEEL